jgi:preprotein translocase subunit SecF
VVYDRIRENLGKHRGKTFAQIINLSVSETLSRTILTSGATMLSFLAFFVWGTGVIKDFALALLVGIVAGTYSSIYVAAPITEWIDKRFFGGAASGGARRAAGAARAPGKKTAAVV